MTLKLIKGGLDNDDFDVQEDIDYQEPPIEIELQEEESEESKKRREIRELARIESDIYYWENTNIPDTKTEVIRRLIEDVLRFHKDEATTKLLYLSEFEIKALENGILPVRTQRELKCIINDRLIRKRGF